jgi:hypothetical protein
MVPAMRLDRKCPTCTVLRRVTLCDRCSIEIEEPTLEIYQGEQYRDRKYWQFCEACGPLVLAYLMGTHVSPGAEPTGENADGLKYTCDECRIKIAGYWLVCDATRGMLRLCRICAEKRGEIIGESDRFGSHVPNVKEIDE